MSQMTVREYLGQAAKTIADMQSKIKEVDAALDKIDERLDRLEKLVLEPGWDDPIDPSLPHFFPEDLYEPRYQNTDRLIVPQDAGAQILGHDKYSKLDNRTLRANLSEMNVQLRLKKRLEQ